MQLKKYSGYRMDFTGKWSKIFCFCIGAAVFLLVMHFFVARDPQSVGTAELILCAVLPLVLMFGLITLYRLIRLNSPGVFAILGSVMCLSLVICNYLTVSLLQFVLSFIWYLLSGFVLLATAGAYLPGRLPAASLFWIALLMRFFIFGPSRLQSDSWMQELSCYFVIVGLASMTLSMKQVKS